MQLNAIFTFLAVAVTFTLSANADTIVAFDGSTCDGNEGNTVQCDGSCHQFAGRHSVSLSGGSHCVTYFENNACTFVEAEGGTDILGAGCHNVNTGGPVNSFICAPTSFCLV